MTELARQHEKVPPNMVALLDRLIDERSEYTYWMSQKSTDDTSSSSSESHQHFIKVLKETKTILVERMEPEATTAARQTCPIRSETTEKSPQTVTKTLGKRKISSNALHGSGQRKAAKTGATTPKPLHVLKATNSSTATHKKQQDEWRQVVVKSCDKEVEKTCAAATKPISYAAAARVAITA